MPTEVIMPKVDMDMETGTLSTWHVAEGETVRQGAPLFDIETDKAAMEVEAPATGRLHHILAAPGAKVGVGLPVAWIYAEGETVAAAPPTAGAPAPAPEPAVAAAAPPAQTAAPAPAPTSSPVHAPARTPGAIRATPVARRLAREADVALAGLTGTGPCGRIQRQDVEAYLAALARAPRPARRNAAWPEAADALSATGTAVPAEWTEEAGELFTSTRPGTGTPILLLHGFAADATGWLPLERELPAGVPLIRIDLPSHGRSPRRRVRDFPDLVRAVRTAFDAGVEAAGTGPVHIVAHSLGAAVALAVADVRPRSVARLTLIAPAGLGPEIDGAALTGIARASRAESLAPWLRRLAGSPDSIGWDFARAAMLSRADPEMRAAQMDMADALFPDGVQSFDVTAALERVTAPTTILWGRRDKIIPWRHALSAKSEMALHLLRDLGHIPHVERPGLVAGIIAQSLGGAGRT